MASRNKNNNWDRIQLGVRNTERLIRQRDYNSAMVKARQTLEFMVRMLADRDRTGSMNDSDLKEMIDILYQNRQITKTSCDRYHKIRMIGNKAAHEGDNSASNADLAFQMLSQELRVFARDYQNRRSPQRTTSRAAGSRSSRKGRRRSGRRRYRITPFDLFKLLIPVICILLLFFVIRLLKPKTDETESTSAPVSTEVPVPVETTSPIETMVPSTEIPSTETQPMVYRTTDVLNVRSEPSTDGARLGKLNSGVTVEYVRAENDEWTVIIYYGRESYVASQYLTAE